MHFENEEWAESFEKLWANGSNLSSAINNSDLNAFTRY